MGRPKKEKLDMNPVVKLNDLTNILPKSRIITADDMRSFMMINFLSLVLSGMSVGLWFVFIDAVNSSVCRECICLSEAFFFVVAIVASVLSIVGWFIGFSQLLAEKPIQ